MKRLLPILLPLLLALSALPAWGDPALKFGVLAFRPKPQTLAQWQPLASYLAEQLGRPVELAVYDYQGLNTAVEQNLVDIVLTNSGHFVLLQERYNLSAPLVTKVTREGRNVLTAYGGVIFTTVEQRTINTLADLAGKRLAATSKDALAGYQIQAFELLAARVPLPAGGKLVLTDNPHDRVVEAVLAGRADAGFVRSGVLESLAHEGKLDLGRIKILNRQDLPSFPYASSTRLYPEWPLGVTPRIDDHLARRLVIALLALDPESVIARAADIDGFTIPADYSGVEEMLRRLRLPPFDTAPEFTLADLWRRYFIWIIGLGLLLGVVAAMAVRLAVQKRLVEHSQQRFATLFESSPEPIWILANRRFIDCNRAAVAILGLSDKASLLQQTPADFSPARQPEGEESGAKANRLLAAAANGQTQRFEWLYLTPGGNEITIVLSLTPITLRGQAMVLAVGHDITERRLNERLLAEKEERFRTVADFTLGWEYWSGPGQELLYMSPSCESITGYCRDEFIADPSLLTRIIHPDDLQQAEAHRHDINNQADGRLDFRIVRRDGDIRWLEHICHPVWGNDGLYKGRRVSNRDITERMQAEEAKRQLSDIVDRSLNEIYVFAPETLTFTHVNQGALQNLHYTQEEIKRLTVLDIKPELTEASFRAMIQPLLSAEQDELVFRTVHRRADGTRYPVEVHWRLVGTGSQRAFLAVVFDITEREKLEAEKVRLELQCQQLQKTESLGRMAGAIAHNFNNMLAAVMGNLELAMDHVPPGLAPIDNLVEAMKAARRAADMSGLMLTYLGQTVGKDEPLDLSEVCRQSVTSLRGSMPRTVELDTELPASGPIVRADAHQVRQILGNLVTNAWEAIGEGSGVIRLAVTTVAPAAIPEARRFPLNWRPHETRYACLEVTDTGCGITEQDIDVLFDPFFTTKFTGRGLGLPVVLGLVRAHRGCITVESTTGQGSIFRVFLPVAAEAVPPVPEKRGTAPEFVGGGTVLLVEDEQIVRTMTKALLMRLGFAVLEAKDGREAVAIFRQHREAIRCVISDLSMPVMDGWETLTALRQLAPGIPVILASGYDKAQVMAGEHPEKPTAFLGKPYAVAALREVIRQALQA